MYMVIPLILMCFVFLATLLFVDTFVRVWFIDSTQLNKRDTKMEVSVTELSYTQWVYAALASELIFPLLSVRINGLVTELLEERGWLEKLRERNDWLDIPYVPGPPCWKLMVLIVVVNSASCWLLFASFQIPDTAWSFNLQGCIFALSRNQGILLLLATSWVSTWTTMSSFLPLIGYDSIGSQLKHVLCHPLSYVCFGTVAALRAMGIATLWCQSVLTMLDYGAREESKWIQTIFCLSCHLIFAGGGACGAALLFGSFIDEEILRPVSLPLEDIESPESDQHVLLDDGTSQGSAATLIAPMSSLSMVGTARLGMNASWINHKSCFKYPSPEFVKLKLIAKGAFGQVFEGTFKGRKVAAKQHHALTPMGVELYGLKDDPASFDAIVEEVAVEIRAFLGLGHHQHLVEFVAIGVGDFQGQPMPEYILSEFIAGCTLEPWLLNRPEHDEVCRVVGEICDGLNFMHRSNFIHRDLKPANVLLAFGRTVKITDFGLSTVRGGGSDRTRTQCGTPCFAAPEIASSGRYGSKVDIYALGCIMLTWLQQALPAAGHEIRWSQLASIDTGTPFRELAGKCMAKNERERPTAIEAFHMVKRC